MTLESMGIVPAVIATAKSLPAAIKAGQFVIEQWTAHRRNKFLMALLENLQVEQATGKIRREVDDALDSLLKTETNSEVLYDAYRRVCFSKTKNIGPRIIGLLTAELLNNASTSEENEEMIFEAAEQLGDLDFVHFKNYYQGLLNEVVADPELKRKVMRSGDEIIEVTNEEAYEVGGHKNSEAHLFPPDLRTTHGVWAARLESCGLLTREVTQQTMQVKEDSERHIDYDQTWVTTIVTLTYKAATIKLFKLLLRARSDEAKQADGL